MPDIHPTEAPIIPALSIITNHVPRDLVSLADLPLDVQIDFDYIREAGDGNSGRLVNYRGTWYDTQDTWGML